MKINFKFCRRGITRTVILVGNVAIKIPAIHFGWKNFLQGMLANLQEITFSKAGWEELAPILFYIPGGWLVVMRRARILTQEEFENLDIESWKDRGDYIIPVESKFDSFGYIDNRLVAVDYGN